MIYIYWAGEELARINFTPGSFESRGLNMKITYVIFMNIDIYSYAEW